LFYSFLCGRCTAIVVAGFAIRSVATMPCFSRRIGQFVAGFCRMTKSFFAWRFSLFRLRNITNGSPRWAGLRAHSSCASTSFSSRKVCRAHALRPQTPALPSGEEDASRKATAHIREKSTLYFVCVIAQGSPSKNPHSLHSLAKAACCL
jgi:hypothetical protein